MSDLAYLPGPVAELWEWQYAGSCRDTGSDAFFHPEGERGAARRMRVAAAKEICASCPVLQACRAHALSTREVFGVWGGLSEDERDEMLTGRGELAG